MKKKIICAILTISCVILITSSAFANNYQNNSNPIIESQQIQPLTSEIGSNIARSGSYGIITTDGVRIRSTPSLSGTVRGLLYKGDEVEIADADYYGDGYSWKFIYSMRTGISGYVVENYIQIND